MGESQKISNLNDTFTVSLLTELQCEHSVHTRFIAHFNVYNINK